MGTVHDMGKRIRGPEPNAPLVDKSRWRATNECYMRYREGAQQPTGASNEQWTAYVEWRRAWYDALNAYRARIFGPATRGWYYSGEIERGE
jgi:hypothetical protein